MFRSIAKLKHGVRVQIYGITDPCDEDLNGQIGTVGVLPPGFPIRECGVWLDNPYGASIPVALYRKEVRLLEPEENE